MMSRRLALLTLVAVLAGCSRNKAVDANGADSPPPEVTGPFTVYIAVTNQGFFDVNVFLMRTGDAVGRRLGTVGGNSSTTFRFPDTDLQSGWRLQVAARSVGGRQTWVSQQLTMAPGNVARLMLLSNPSGDLNRSQFYLEPQGDTSR